MSSSISTSAQTGIRLGFVTAGHRSLSRATLLLVGLSVALVVSGGIIERRVTTLGAVDRSLLSTFRLVLPLYAFAVTTAACQRLGLREAAWSVARFGAARRDVALGMILSAVAASTLGGVILAVFAVLSAYAPSSRSLVTELFVSGWIGGLVAAAYTAWFVLGSAFFDRGRGRWLVLLLDFFLGGGTSAIAAFFPRSHARSLLGDLGPTQFSQPQSSMALLAMLFIGSSLALLRTRD
ncbi:MAG TPA: hypothetical protein PK156_14675 [Polyangium sp.]|nr:hypothetical protein [Polyangium sp.]